MILVLLNTLNKQLSGLTSDTGRVASRTFVATRMDSAQVGEGECTRIGVHFTDIDSTSATSKQTAQRLAIFCPAEVERFVALAHTAQQSSADSLFQDLLFFSLSECVHPGRNCVSHGHHIIFLFCFNF